MIRLVLVLCGGLYFSLMILGQDHGQKRYGLMLADQQPPVTAPEPPVDQPAELVVFIPAPTVMKAAPVEAPVVTKVAADVVAPEAPLPEPEVAGGTLFTVAASTANVREGPGKAFGVLGSLARGEQVLVVEEADPTQGWSRVRLEGDGMEGYIATRLLSE